MEVEGQDSQVKAAGEVVEGEQASQMMEEGVEAQTGVPVQHGLRTDPQIQLHTGT